MPPARTTRGAALRPVHGADPDDAARAAAAVARRSARRAARPAPELAVHGCSSRDGGELSGVTIGHVETDFGLFIFPPLDDDGSVKRTFIPRARLHRLRDRPEDRRGAGRRAGHRLRRDREGGRGAAAAAHAKARRHPGRQADRHARAAARGDRAPAQDAAGADRRGAALARPDRRRASSRKRSSSSSSTAACRSARCWCGWASSRATDLQTALARKMGYPLVDLDAFPVEAKALRKLPYGVAARLRVMPLLVRDGRLVVALDDPVAPRRRRRGRVQRRHEGDPGARAAASRSRPRCTPPTTRSARRASRARPRTWRRRSPTTSTSRPRPRPRRRRPTSSSRRSRRKASSGIAADARRQADRAERQLARPPAQQHDRRGAQGRRLRHPHRELSRQGEDPRPLPQGRHPAHLPRAAGELPQRADRPRQDHVRSRHLRAPAAAGRQDQLRQVRAAAPDRAARRDDPDQQRPRGRRPAPARLGAADPGRHARPLGRAT